MYELAKGCCAVMQLESRAMAGGREEGGREKTGLDTLHVSITTTRTTTSCQYNTLLISVLPQTAGSLCFYAVFFTCKYMAAYHL
jgi:hypothetical protein